jgi:hypothetical protein
LFFFFLAFAVVVVVVVGFFDDSSRKRKTKVPSVSISVRSQDQRSSVVSRRRHAP